MRIIEDNQLSKIFLQAQQNLAKMLPGDDSLLLMYLCKSQMRRRGPQTLAGSLGKQCASFGVVAPRNRRHRCHGFKQLRGWGERAEQHKADSLLLSSASSFFPSCWVQISEGRTPGCLRDHQPLQEEAPRCTGRGTRGAAPSTRSFICTRGSASPSSSSSKIRGEDDTK